jgi:hypothetical protein
MCDWFLVYASTNLLLMNLAVILFSEICFCLELIPIKSSQNWFSREGFSRGCLLEISCAMCDWFLVYAFTNLLLMNLAVILFSEICFFLELILWC